MINDATLRKHWRALRFMTRCVAIQFRIDADDLFSDVLERIWKYRDTFTGDDNAFMQWCVCITYNRCKDVRRYAQTRARINNATHNREIPAAGNAMLAIEAKDILCRFKKFITERYGYYYRDIIWKKAKGYSIKRNELGTGNNAFHVAMFNDITRMRNSFIISYIQ